MSNEQGTLTAEVTRYSTYVRDAAGGLWYPDDETVDQIRSAKDPEAEALRICQEEPMRGTWHS